jgi:hypothetical protein
MRSLTPCTSASAWPEGQVEISSRRWPEIAARIGRALADGQPPQLPGASRFTHVQMISLAGDSPARLWCGRGGGRRCRPPCPAMDTDIQIGPTGQKLLPLWVV